jgi:hypothetical protein
LWLAGVLPSLLLARSSLAQNAAPPPAKPTPASPAPAAPSPAATTPTAPAPAPTDAQAAAPDAAPVATPTPATPNTATPNTAPTPAPAILTPRPPKVLSADVLEEAGYVPGYRSYSGLGLSPYTPQVPGLPGGFTPGFAAPMPSKDWTFTFNGYMSASMEVSTAEREDPQPGQAKTVLHTLPVIIDEYNSFTSTNSRPGNWVNLNFSYGNEIVTSSVSINTYNPSGPTNFWQIGSQYFINNMFLRFRAPEVEGFRAGWTVGYFTNNYGALGQYGGGLYTHAITGGPQGVGETIVIEHDVADGLVAVFEDGLMGNAGGHNPNDIVQGGGTEGDPEWASSLTHHAHLGLISGGSTTLQAQIHYMVTWHQDDRLQRNPVLNPLESPADIPTTREVDESYVRDGRLTVVGFDAKMTSQAYGVLGFGMAYIDGYYAFPLRGVTTFGGEPERLTNSWWGVSTGGTGTMLLGGISYTFSVARLLLAPDPFSGQAPDLVITTGATFGRTTSTEKPYDGRVRHKYGIDGLYTVLPWLGFGLRLDRVVPSSKDPEQTFHVVAPRVLFKTDWNSRENISLGYVKWFLGKESHLDGLSARASEQIDDQMFTLNFNMYF